MTCEQDHYWKKANGHKRKKENAEKSTSGFSEEPTFEVPR